MPAARYAVYAAPEPGSRLAELGSAILGYDAERGADRPLLVPPGFEAPEWERLTAEPRRYGFHATLKAPFRLAGAGSPEDLGAAVAALARTHAPIEFSLQLERIGSFFALVPTTRSKALHLLADTLVSELDRFRAPMSSGERARRIQTGLSPGQLALLDTWGYPYVFEEFQFHMTLSGRVPPARAGAAEEGLAALLAEAIEPPFQIGSLCIFEQPEPEARFHMRGRFPLGG